MPKKKGENDMNVITPQISGGSGSTVRFATGTFKLPFDENNQPSPSVTVDVGFAPRAVFASRGYYYYFACERSRSGGLTCPSELDITRPPNPTLHSPTQGLLSLLQRVTDRISNGIHYMNSSHMHRYWGDIPCR